MQQTDERLQMGIDGTPPTHPSQVLTADARLALAAACYDSARQQLIEAQRILDTSETRAEHVTGAEAVEAVDAARRGLIR